MKIAMFKKNCLLMVVIFFIMSMQGCIFIPLMESVRKTGVSESSRKGLLPPQIKKFQDALHWGNPTEALSYADDEYRQEISEQMQEISEDQHIVESKVKSIVFADNSYEATVEITVRSYKVPVYVVQDVFETQVWRFTLTNGWKIISREITTTKPKHQKSKVS